MRAICIRNRIDCDFAHLHLPSLLPFLFFPLIRALLSCSLLSRFKSAFVLLPYEFPFLFIFNTVILNRPAKKRGQNARWGMTELHKIAREDFFFITLAQTRELLFFIFELFFLRSSGELNSTSSILNIDFRFFLDWLKLI